MRPIKMMAELTEELIDRWLGRWRQRRKRREALSRLWKTTRREARLTNLVVIDK